MESILKGRGKGSVGTTAEIKVRHPESIGDCEIAVMIMDRKPYHFPIDSDHCFRLFAEFHVARSDCIHHFFELMPLVDFLIPPPLL